MTPQPNGADAKTVARQDDGDTVDDPVGPRQIGVIFVGFHTLLVNGAQGVDWLF